MTSKKSAGISCSNEDLEYAWGESCFLETFGDCNCREAVSFTWLDDDGVSSRKSGRGFVCHKHKRDVEGGDPYTNAQWLVTNELRQKQNRYEYFDEAITRIHEGLAFQFICPSSVICELAIASNGRTSETLDGSGQFHVGEINCFAGLQSF